MTVVQEDPCPRCGSVVTPAQEYCIECGLKLPLEVGVRETVSSAWARRVPWYPGEWLWPTLVAFVVALLATAAVVAAQESRLEGQEPLLVATDEPTGDPPPPVEEEPAPTAPTGAGEPAPLPPPEGEGTEEPPAEEEPVEPQPANQIVDWPEGTDGFTVVLASLPEAGGRAPAVARAREAAEAGLTDVGVLRSSSFPSLRPGYVVVFSGIHGTRADAEAAVGAAREAGFDTAYVSPIAS